MQQHSIIEASSKPAKARDLLAGQRVPGWAARGKAVESDIRLGFNIAQPHGA